LHRTGAKIDLWILKSRIKSLIDSNTRFGRDVIKRNTTLMALSLMIFYYPNQHTGIPRAPRRKKIIASPVRGTAPSAPLTIALNPSSRVDSHANEISALIQVPWKYLSMKLVPTLSPAPHVNHTDSEVIRWVF
jgi:hypothetical protein